MKSASIRDMTIANPAKIIVASVIEAPDMSESILSYIKTSLNG
jgi:hypothetical protein